MVNTKRKILFIINPVAGKGKTIEILPIIKQKFDVHFDNIEYLIHVSKCEGDISRAVNQYYHDGWNEFVAIGGDGSLSELINGFKFPVERMPSIGIIPMGTGNDFVKNLPEKKHLDLIFDAIINQSTSIVDVGVVNNFNFINVCSFGIDGPIIVDTNRFKKWLPGKSSYMVSTMKAGISFKASQVSVVADGIHYEGDMLLIAVGNGKYFGGGMNICPDAILNDGLFDVCLVNGVKKTKFIKEMPKVYSGKLSDLKEVIYLKCKEISIHVTGRQYYINADGNLLGQTPASLKIVENAVKIYTNDY